MSFDAMKLKLNGASDEEVERQTGLKHRGRGFYATDECWAMILEQARRKAEEPPDPDPIGTFMGVPIVPTGTLGGEPKAADLMRQLVDTLYKLPDPPESPLITAWREYLARKKAAGITDGMAVTGIPDLEPPPMPNRPLTMEEAAFIYPKRCL